MTVGEFNKCVDLYSDGIYRFALKLLKSAELAQDNVQDSFERLWVRHSDVDFGKAKSYLFTTSYNASIDTIRKEKRKTESATLINNETSGTIANFDVKQIIDKAVDLLPEVQKTVLMLRDYEGYSYDEIGEITGLSESQVKVYIYRARLFLKEKLVSIDNLV
ncbi:MAG TPA: RNA polymerase sigma factor [Tenuifilaceae bacterium]|nr:RNA polymerase sigma factor [Tenuifilaceae bacterium]HRX32258.1 RNA polymerase sigma factor [Tenuifilaceae bacterium]